MIEGVDRPKLLIAINTSWNIVNFRTGLIRGLIAKGYDVVVAAPRDRFSDEITPRTGARFVELPMRGHGRSPTEDAALLTRFVALMRRERPAAFLGFTVKPNVFGSLAAQLCGVPRVNNIAGLGSVFNERGATAKIVVLLYRIALRGAHRVFFQNDDDLSLFVARRIVRRAQTALLPGSGVDTARFVPGDRPLPAADAPFTFLLIARLLREKGVAELVEAARIVRAAHPRIRVQILGPVDAANPASIPRAQLDQWAAAGDIEYLGTADDVRPFLAAADCFVLPSYYREGTPRALLEAAAMAKPIITTDMPGCRDVVDPGSNGFLVPPRDVQALAERMAEMAAAPAEVVEAMGRASRRKAEGDFDERIVVERYLGALDAVLTPGNPAGGSRQANG